MKNMTLILMLFLSNTFSSFAGESHQLTFTGQGFETFNMDTVRTVTRYRTETRDSTCTRQVPYQKEVCGYETRYERECRWEPGRQRCYTDYRQECRNVTRYRQECTQGPSRRVCRQTPGRQQCRTLPSGERRCRNVPGRQICETKPGQRQCRQVPYQARECRQVPYQRCEQVPGREVCQNVPRQVWECRMETRYRTEEYSCRKSVQVPYDVKQDVEARVDVNFKNESGLNSPMTASFQLLRDGDVQDLIVEARDYVIKRDKDIDSHDSDVLRTTATFNYTLFNKDEVLAPVRQKIRVTDVTPWYLSFIIGKSTLPSDTELSAVIRRSSGEVLFGGEIDDKNSTMSEQTYGYFVTVKLKDLGVDILSGDFLDIDLSVKQKVRGVMHIKDSELQRTDSFASQQVR